ncbi:DUF1566 domain-containing protein [Tamlana fucoidanivorans]|uniref:DUF1566 domain-containing protein n=1 Tax=Allotamlana fucoidanivorans TaxID=2583814 RepID=A0A5C4SP09_9FLAO|nr:DUF1566 domain-containing protein [Tamlana fucoidanivorans]TNJ46014.1 DUF1566 domain-containing protein [Tamlana fucoidanivorans]
MRKIEIILVFGLLLVGRIYSQTPEMMSYQAVVRDENSDLVKNRVVGMQVSILKDSQSGNSVYTETHTPQTNDNGLLSIEVGNGITSDNIADIDWSEGTYYIKTEIDIEGGTNYTISAISQFLSVPYALHAKTADYVKGLITSKSHYVGELFGGGIVFHVNTAGDHGLIVSMLDLADEGVWSSVTDREIGESAQSSWNGQSNTGAVVSQGGANNAASICQNYSNEDYGTGVFSDWYLPSVTELDKLWVNLYEVQKGIESVGGDNTGEVQKAFYWSSTEANQFTAWGFNFYNGNAYGNIKFSKGYVRAIRSF